MGPRLGRAFAVGSSLLGVLVALVLVSAFPSVAAASTSTHDGLFPASRGNALSSIDLAGSELFSAPFAQRAGYAAGDLHEVHGSEPAEGSVLVALTFEPRNESSFFAPLPPNAPALEIFQIADRFGLSPAQYTAIEGYFLSKGLSVVHAWPDRLSLTVEGSAASIGSAFGTSLLSGTYRGASVMFPETPPELPSNFEPLVGSVLGLSSGFDSFSTALGTSPSPERSAPAFLESNEVTPTIARQIYDLSSLYNVSGSFHSAASEGIALLLWGDGYSPTDLDTFFSQDYPSSFPAPTVTAEPVDGAPPPSENAVSDPCKDSQELTLDLEWAGSMAPGANLYAVYAPETNPPGCSPTDAAMADALSEAVSLPVAAISMSFGTPDATSGGLAVAWQTGLSVAVQRGITLLAATGDLGGDAAANCQGGPSPEYPSTSPDVLAVGGTSVSLNRGLTGMTFSETAWAQSGGGYSTQYGAPSWQSGYPSRGVPDVAATAALNFLYFNGQDETAAGTSFATPLWAGLIVEMDAIRGSDFGLIAPRLYAVGGAETAAGSRTPAGLAGITSGANCVASAGPGWNPVTGWGSPRALALFEDLTSTFVNLSVAASPGTVAEGASVTIASHLANATDGSPIANVPVAVSLVSTVSVGPCTGTFGSSTATTDGGGNVSIVLTIPSCYLGSHAVAQVVVSSDGYYGTNSTTISVNLLGLLPALGPLAVYPTSIVTFVVIAAAASLAGYFLGRRGPSAPTVRSHAPSPEVPTGAAGASPAASSPENPAPGESPVGESQKR